MASEQSKRRRASPLLKELRLWARRARRGVVPPDELLSGWLRAVEGAQQDGSAEAAELVDRLVSVQTAHLNARLSDAEATDLSTDPSSSERILTLTRYLWHLLVDIDRHAVNTDERESLARRLDGLQTRAVSRARRHGLGDGLTANPGFVGGASLLSGGHASAVANAGISVVGLASSSTAAPRPSLIDDESHSIGGDLAKRPDFPPNSVPEQEFLDGLNNRTTAFLGSLTATSTIPLPEGEYSSLEMPFVETTEVQLDWIEGEPDPWQQADVIARARAATTALASRGVKVELVRGRPVPPTRYESNSGQPAAAFSIAGPTGPVLLDRLEILERAALVSQRPGFLQVIVAPRSATRTTPTAGSIADRDQYTASSMPLVMPPPGGTNPPPSSSRSPTDDSRRGPRDPAASARGIPEMTIPTLERSPLTGFGSTTLPEITFASSPSQTSRGSDAVEELGPVGSAQPSPTTSTAVPNQRTPMATPSFPSRVSGEPERVRITLDWVAGEDPWRQPEVLDRAIEAARALENRGVSIEFVRGREVPIHQYDAGRATRAADVVLPTPTGAVFLDHLDVLDRAMIMAQRPGHLQVLVAPRAAFAFQSPTTPVGTGTSSIFAPPLAVVTPEMASSDVSSPPPPATLGPETTLGPGARSVSPADAAPGSAVPRTPASNAAPESPSAEPMAGDERSAGGSRTRVEPTRPTTASASAAIREAASGERRTAERVRIALDWVAGEDPWQQPDLLERAAEAARRLERRGIQVEFVRGREVPINQYDANLAVSAAEFAVSSPLGPVLLEGIDVLDQAVPLAQRPGFLQVLVAPRNLAVRTAVEGQAVTPLALPFASPLSQPMEVAPSDDASPNRPAGAPARTYRDPSGASSAAAEPAERSFSGARTMSAPTEVVRVVVDWIEGEDPWSQGRLPTLSTDVVRSLADQGVRLEFVRGRAVPADLYGPQFERVASTLSIVGPRGPVFLDAVPALAGAIPVGQRPGQIQIVMPPSAGQPSVVARTTPQVATASPLSFAASRLDLPIGTSAAPESVPSASKGDQLAQPLRPVASLTRSPYGPGSPPLTTAASSPRIQRWLATNDTPSTDDRTAPPSGIARVRSSESPGEVPFAPAALIPPEGRAGLPDVKPGWLANPGRASAVLPASEESPATTERQSRGSATVRHGPGWELPPVVRSSFDLGHTFDVGLTPVQRASAAAAEAAFGYGGEAVDRPPSTHPAPLGSNILMRRADMADAGLPAVAFGSVMSESSSAMVESASATSGVGMRGSDDEDIREAGRPTAAGAGTFFGQPSPRRRRYDVGTSVGGADTTAGWDARFGPVPMPWIEHHQPGARQLDAANASAMASVGRMAASLGSPMATMSLASGAPALPTNPPGSTFASSIIARGSRSTDLGSFGAAAASGTPSENSPGRPSWVIDFPGRNAHPTLEFGSPVPLGVLEVEVTRPVFGPYPEVSMGQASFQRPGVGAAVTTVSSSGPTTTASSPTSFGSGVADASGSMPLIFARESQPEVLPLRQKDVARAQPNRPAVQSGGGGSMPTTTTNVSQSPSDTPAPSQAPNVDDLARQVYAAIKQRLAVERERGGISRTLRKF